MRNTIIREWKGSNENAARTKSAFTSGYSEAQPHLINRHHAQSEGSVHHETALSTYHLAEKDPSLHSVPLRMTLFNYIFFRRTKSTFTSGYSEAQPHIPNRHPEQSEGSVHYKHLPATSTCKKELRFDGKGLRFLHKLVCPFFAKNHLKCYNYETRRLHLYHHK